MLILELQTTEAKFTYDMAGSGHFIIDCACKGKDGKYSGSFYKQATDFLKDTTTDYHSLTYKKYEHTFLLQYIILNQQLRYNHSEKKGKKPLIIVCKDCGREFTFTHESFWELETKMMVEYNKKF